MKKTAVILVTALLLVGCSAISNGTITAKTYHEAYDYPVTYCALYDSKMNCKMWGQRWEHVSEKWVFDLQRGDQTGFAYVSKSEFESYNVGDYYDNLGER